MNTRPTPIPRKVKKHISEDEIKRDLSRYREAALSVKGISDAVVINRDSIYVDIRVPYKCAIPRCSSYGICSNCPPNAIPAAETQKLVECYRHAIFIKNEVPSNVVAGEELTQAIASGKPDAGQKYIEAGRAYIAIFKAVAMLESMAFYDGYYLAMGFSAGSCKETLCTKFQTCRVLDGESCRRPFFARPSMEAAGFDVFRMATEVGWDVYPIGSSCQPGDVPHGTLMGLVLVT